jgi:site-specific DNA recombinase
MTLAIKSAVLYARVSSKDQEREGFSIPAQVKLLKEYALKHGFKIVREFVDVETAKCAGRKQFGEMVRFFQQRPECRVVIVEKTDRLYRNFADCVTLEDLGVEIHLPKEGQVLNKESKSQAKLVHGIQLVIARNYIENLREEVKKGMREKAEQGIYPTRAPFGYCNNKLQHTIEVDPEKALVIKRIFQLYASGNYSLSSLRKLIAVETGRVWPKSHLERTLKSPFYIGFFVWDGKTHKGTHTPLISAELFEQVQSVFRGHNRSKYRKHSFAFGGMLQCAHDNCLVTAERKKNKYTYYRCTGYRGKCSLPYMREADLSVRLGQLLKDIHIPDDVLTQLQDSLSNVEETSRQARKQEHDRLQQRLTAVRKRIDQAYTDKLDGKITEDFWSRKTAEWQGEEQQIQMAIHGLQGEKPDHLPNAKKTLELANKAYFLYLTQTPEEQAKLLKIVLSNCRIDGVSLYPTYRKPFDLIFERAKSKDWRPRRDLNPCYRRERAFQAFLLVLAGVARSEKAQHYQPLSHHWALDGLASLGAIYPSNVTCSSPLPNARYN